MPDFRLVEKAALPPSTCALCGGAQGPFVDTLTSRPPWGRLYVCIRTCAPVVGRLAGMVFPEGVEALEDEIEQLRDDLAGANERIAEAAGLLGAAVPEPVH